jgi:hypothetical protein
MDFLEPFSYFVKDERGNKPSPVALQKLLAKRMFIIPNSLLTRS